MKVKEIKEKLIQGIQTYCKENHFEDVIIGLSGGIDSALVLALACEALGAKHVHTLMMKTKYTSLKSINLAQQIADLNKVEHKTINIQNLVDNFLKTVDFKSKNPITEQNIQARIRGNILMMYSNEKGYLLLACGNKSEIAMGYCTLYGDTCGGLAPIGDVYKTNVYQIAQLINAEGKFSIPVEIIERQPSAELAENQQDTDSLPTYEILDKILKSYIFGKEKPDKENLELVTSIQKRFDRNKFKHQQLPPILMVN